ncbi:MAG: dihydroorotate dehydrogenase [Candidatus Sumerlaeales bacterium]|nr:dihydroorotate dehydrogenase [Candidatus Sumerlaeales bacterium]
MSVNLSVSLGTLRLKNPVTVASGTYGYGKSYDGYYPPSNLGGIVIKGITSASRFGNPTPRICETPSGMLNSIGLQNIGIDELERNYAELFKDVDTAIIANISGINGSDFAELATRVSAIPQISAVELNVSCPNLKSGGVDFGKNPAAIRDITKASIAATALPVFVKLTPNITDIVSVASAAMEAGATGVSLINTVQAMKIDIENRVPYLRNTVGGLSGPAIHPIAVRMVWQVWKSLRCPIIGMGGITCAEDAIELMMAGACAISIGTMNFVNPMIGNDIINDISDWCEDHDVSSACDLVGCAHNK